VRQWYSRNQGWSPSAEYLVTGVFGAAQMSPCVKLPGPLVRTLHSLPVQGANTRNMPTATAAQPAARAGLPARQARTA